MDDTREQEWLTTQDYREVLYRAATASRSTRKWRCYALACVGLIEHLLTPVHRRALEVNERFVEGKATNRERADARATLGEADYRPIGYSLFESLRWAMASPTDIVSAAQNTVPDSVRYVVELENGRDAVDPLHQKFIGFLRDIVGNPFRPAKIEPAWKRWNGGAVVHLAQVIADEQSFDQMPILADALEEAGCSDSSILDHCRATGHVRGCWVVDLILGKK
jgi:hypothetical protein